MTRRLFLLSIAIALFAAAHAQDLPAWVTKIPKAGNGTYMYVKESAVGNSETDARNQAVALVFQTTANRLGQAVSSAAVYEAAQKGTDLQVLSQEFRIPINKVCEHTERLKDGKVRVYVLCQVAQSGNVAPEWDNFNGCEERKQYKDGIALVESMFIPGLGQMAKRHYGEGAATLVGEVLLVSAGFGTYFVAREELNIMRTPNITYEQFAQAYKTYNNMRITSYVVWGAAAAFYVYNLCRAYTLQPKYKNTLSVHPAIMPAIHNNAYGIGITYHIH